MKEATHNAHNFPLRNYHREIISLEEINHLRRTQEIITEKKVTVQMEMLFLFGQFWWMRRDNTKLFRKEEE
jgi:hypothetical protein